MGADRKRSSRRRVQTPRELGASPSAWKLEDAKARFSEVVRRARSDGPQRVSVRGKDAVVVVSAEEFERLLPPDPGYKPLVAFLEGLHLTGLDLTRERDAELPPVDRKSTRLNSSH